MLMCAEHFQDSDVLSQMLTQKWGPSRIISLASSGSISRGSEPASVWSLPIEAYSKPIKAILGSMSAADRYADLHAADRYAADRHAASIRQALSNSG